MHQPSDMFLPYGRQSIDDADVAAVAKVLHSDYLTTGPAVGEFEADFAHATGAKHAVSCSSGTAALHLAALALRLGEGDVRHRADADVSRNRQHGALCRSRGAVCRRRSADRPADPGDVAGGASRRRAKRPKPSCPFTSTVSAATCAAIKDVADRHGLAVVEDACHAIGAARRWRLRAQRHGRILIASGQNDRGGRGRCRDHQRCGAGRAAVAHAQSRHGARRRAFRISRTGLRCGR